MLSLADNQWGIGTVGQRRPKGKPLFGPPCPWLNEEGRVLWRIADKRADWTPEELDALRRRGHLVKALHYTTMRDLEGDGTAQQPTP